MRFLYTGDSKKENIEKFVVDALNDVFTEVDVFEESCEMKDALNYLFAVRNRLNVGSIKIWWKRV